MRIVQGTFKQDDFWLRKKDKLGWLKPPVFADVKYDGEYCVADTRALSCPSGLLVNAYGKARTDSPILIELPKESVIYGELHWGRGKNGELYDMLSNKLSNMLNFTAFDASLLNGVDISGLTLIERRELLMQAVGSANTSVVETSYCESMEEVNQAFDAYVKRGFEGIVVKQVNSKLQFGASCTWVKLKHTLMADLIITAIDPSQERIECAVPGRLKPLGVKVMNKDKALLQTGDVVEIQHYGVLSGGGLRHPVYLRKRDPNKKVSVDV